MDTPTILLPFKELSGREQPLGEQRKGLGLVLGRLAARAELEQCNAQILRALDEYVDDTGGVWIFSDEIELEAPNDVLAVFEPAISGGESNATSQRDAPGLRRVLGQTGVVDVGLGGGGGHL